MLALEDVPGTRRYAARAHPPFKGHLVHHDSDGAPPRKGPSDFDFQAMRAARAAGGRGWRHGLLGGTPVNRLGV